MLQIFEKSLAMNVSWKHRTWNHQHFAYLKFISSININIKNQCVKISFSNLLLIKKLAHIRNIVIAIIFDRKCDEMRREIRRRSRENGITKEGEKACVHYALRLPPQKGRPIERKGYVTLCKCAGSSSETPALKILTRWFLPHTMPPNGVKRRLTARTKGGRESDVLQILWLDAFSGDTVAVWIGDKPGPWWKGGRGGQWNGEMGGVRIAGEVGNRGSMHYGDSIVIGLAAVFQDPRVYLWEFIFGNALSLFRARQGSDLSFIRGSVRRQNSRILSRAIGASGYLSGVKNHRLVRAPLQSITPSSRIYMTM